MIQIRYEGSRIRKPWVVAEGEFRQLWFDDRPRWETDKIHGTFNLRDEATQFLLYYHVKGKWPKESGV